MSDCFTYPTHQHPTLSSTSGDFSVRVKYMHYMYVQMAFWGMVLKKSNSGMLYRVLALIFAHDYIVQLPKVNWEVQGFFIDKYSYTP